MTDYIVPNFAPKKVKDVIADVPSGIGVKVKKEGDDGFHDPSTDEEDMEVVTNGPNSQPNSTKTTGEWVGVEIKPV
jgi:hypothetical protein